MVSGNKPINTIAPPKKYSQQGGWQWRIRGDVEGLIKISLS
jgi:hypothetical protein